jgi:hypothetical protein
MSRIRPRSRGRHRRLAGQRPRRAPRFGAPPGRRAHTYAPHVLPRPGSCDCCWIRFVRDVVMNPRPTLHAALLIAVALGGVTVAAIAFGPLALPLALCGGVLLRRTRRRR